MGGSRAGVVGGPVGEDRRGGDSRARRGGAARLLGDKLGLTAGLSEVLARAGFMPVRHRGRALVDAACTLAAGATCLSDMGELREGDWGPALDADGNPDPDAAWWT